MPKELDQIQEKLVEFFKGTDNTGYTLREIATQIGVGHPQTVLNKLNQLVNKGYFVKDTSGYRLVKEPSQDLFYLPVYGFAQCGHNGPLVTEQYTQEKIPVSIALVGTSGLDNCFFVRAKGRSMEPKIYDGDLILIRQQESYQPEDFVFVSHNEQAKLKKIKEKNGRFYLVSVNTEFQDVEIDEYDSAKIIGVIKRIIGRM